MTGTDLNSLSAGGQKPHAVETYLSSKHGDLLILLGHPGLKLLETFHQDDHRPILQLLRPTLTLINVPTKYLLLPLPLVHRAHQLVDNVTLNFDVIGHRHEVLVDANKGVLETSLHSNDPLEQTALTGGKIW